METSNNVSKLRRILKDILFPVEVVPFFQYVKGLKRLPSDRSMCVLAYTDGKENKPECTYIGGEKYVLVENREVIDPLLEVLTKHFKNLRVRVINVDNEMFTVDFFNVAPDKRKNDYIAPAIRFVNSYNGKKPASASAAVYRVNKEGKEQFLASGSKHYEFKHHSDNGAVQITKISEQVEEMLKEFTTISEQVERLKKIEVSEIGKTMEQIVPDAKKYPKKAISTAIELVSYESMLLGSTPNLWLVYTALAQAVKQNDSKLDQMQREDADAIAWENTLNFADGQIKPAKKKK